MAYVPMRISLGSLPEYDDELKSYDLQLDGKIPAEAKEVLLYTFVTTRGDRDDFHRGYYEISTSQGEKNLSTVHECGSGTQNDGSQLL